MCEAKPGLRCAADTRDGAQASLAAYERTNPDGPRVDPLSSVVSQLAPAPVASDGSRDARGGDQFANPADLQRALRERHPGLELWVHEDASGNVIVSKIVVPAASRRAGMGTEVMQTITTTADERGWTLALTPSTDFGGSKAGLERFYRRFGFVPNTGRRRDLSTTEAFVRWPRPVR